MAEKSLGEIDLAALARDRRFFPSPSHWEDEVFYFLMVDRFSDGKERGGYRNLRGEPVLDGTTPLFGAADDGNAVGSADEAARWREAGTRFVGGNLRGLESKLGYLKRLGVTSVWVSPVFKQVAKDETYHGYGIQDFLQVDPHFGTREDLRRLVRAAHDEGIRVILDIILNHAGDVFRYQAGDAPWNGRPYAVSGFRDAGGDVSLPFGPVDLTARPDAFPDGAIWPEEFQEPDAFTRGGYIRNFDFFPEFADGDFFSLKDVRHGERLMVDGVDQIDRYAASPALLHLCQVYKFWIAFADLDGFRLDTVKHMDPGAVRFFVSAMHEFAESLGKENFYVIGEVTGGRDFAVSRLDVTGLDAALGISDERLKMTGLVKGEVDPSDYFDLFRNSLLVQKDSHVWFRDKVITSVDDHDHVDQGSQKHRFCSGGYQDRVLAALALNATTLGIPCIYYGTEQRFDGAGGDPGADRYLREAMFGGDFGAFRSRGRHFFDEDQPVYRELAKVHDVRRQQIALRRGRQYLRPISGNGVDFGLPHRLGGPLRSIVAWSRIFDEREVLCAISTDPAAATTAFVTVDAGLHAAGDVLTCLYSTDGAEIGRTIAVVPRNGKAVSLTVPPAGFVVYG
jgi:glycosidase